MPYSKTWQAENTSQSMNGPDSRQGLDLDACVHQVRGFVKDRCSDICGFLRLDKRVKPETRRSRGSALSLQAPIGSHLSGSSGAKRANDGAVPTLIGTSGDHTISREELGRATWPFAAHTCCPVPGHAEASSRGRM